MGLFSAIGGLLGGGAGGGLFGNLLGGLFGGGVKDPTQKQNSSSVSSSSTDSYQKGFQSQSSGPGEFTAPLFNDLYLPTLAKTFLQQSQPAFAGPLAAKPDPLQIEANKAGEQAAYKAIGQGTGTRDLANELISGATLDPTRAPGFLGVMRASMFPAIRAFTEQMVPQISSNAIANGAYGGSRHGVALGLAADRLGETLADTASQLSYTNYNNERQRQLAAPALLNQAFALDMSPLQVLSSLGAERQGFTQSAINENAQLDQLARTQPWAALQQLGAGLNLVGDRRGYGINEGNSNQASNQVGGGVGQQLQYGGTWNNLQQGLNTGTAADYLNQKQPGMLGGIMQNIAPMVRFGNLL